jgi:hypothetical protein
MSQESHNALNQCLRAVWQRTQRRHATGALLAFARWFIPLFLVIILVDRLAYLPGWLRAVAALALLAFSLRQAWRNGGSSLRRFNATRAAQQIEHAEDGLDSLLVTALQFQEKGASPGTSPAMWEYAQRKAQDAAKQVSPKQVVSMAALQKPLRIAAGIAALFLILAILKGPFLAAGFGRMFTPWLAIAYPTDTQINLGTKEIVIQEGAPATIEIRLSGKKIPKTAELALRTGEGRPREITLDVADRLATYEITSASRNFTFRVKAGDARTDWHQVRVISAPRMAKVAVELDFPDYTDRPNETVQALTLTVPEETKVNWQLTLDTPIRSATLHRDDAEDLPLEIGSDRRTLTLSETASASRGYSFSWIEDRHGFAFTSPRYFLQVASDQPPRVEITAPVANINAMLGRPMPVAIRMSDDHGIGTTRIIHRVNRRPEKTIDLPTPASTEGEQPLDWDYRKELTDLAVGDSLAFFVEVADKYPGENGPHIVRTETRRITFLSREDYLAEITKQMERLLTRVRTLYRQQRAAHDLAVSLDPAAESYLATCQLEAIRQEMVREQLVTTADEVQALLDDLAANQVTDAVESDSLAAIRDAMRTIAADHVARAANLFRSQVGAPTRDPQAATNAVNQAARELAALVLLRGIDASREVFARETSMLAGELTRLRLQLITAAPGPSETLATQADTLATSTDQLLTQLTDGMRYDAKPLAVLGLSRRIHDLRTTNITDALKAVATHAREGKIEPANTALYPLIRPLLEAEFTMRSGAEYARIRDLREQLASWISAQEQLLAETRDTTEPAPLATRQAALRNSIVLATMPGIPAPRAGLLDINYPPLPPADDRRLQAESLMAAAITHLQSGSKEESIARQQDALTALRELDAIITGWSVELAQNTLGVSAQVSDANNRITALEGFETRQIGLLEQTEEVALDDKDPAALIEQQQSLAAELDIFRQELSGGQDGPSKDVLPLISRIESAAKAIENALATLRAKKVEDAIDPQEQAANALTEARTIAQEQLVKFTLQQQLIGFRQAVTNASSGMVDVLGAQKDLIAATTKADEDELKSLLPSQRNLHQCLSEIAPFLDVVASRLDVGTPLVFAASDVEDALLAMEDGDAEDASEIQQTAFESLTKVQGLVSEIAVQTGYISEIVEFLHSLQADGSMLAFRQSQIRQQTIPGDAQALQQALATDAKTYAESITMVAGTINFETLGEKVLETLAGLDLTLDGMALATHMAEALRLIQAGQPAQEAMQAAEKALASQSQHINVIIAMLNGLPNIIVTSAQPPELHRLIAVLDTASKHRALMRQTHSTPEADLPSLTDAQQSLAAAATKASQFEGLSHPMLAKADSQFSPIPDLLKSSNKASATTAQLAADLTLRHFIIEQALILNTAIPPASGSDSDVLTESETDDLDFSEAVEKISDFVSGETPKDKKSEWEILGERNRAALNQNFARELPLEFRATLKDYYERVAK